MPVIKTMDLLQDTKKIALYDGKGFVELIDMMPRVVPQGRTADLAIAQNARVSTQKDYKDVDADRKLIKYLYKNNHSSPFESVTFKFRIKLPIFVERQLIRHRTASVNEESHRYSVAKPEYYLPKLRLQDTKNKQSSFEGDVSLQTAMAWGVAEHEIQQQFEKYQILIDNGVAREVARCILPVCTMTSMIWIMNLSNLFKFLKLRTADDAQREIRDLANAIFELIKPLAPDACHAFEECK